MKDIEAIYNYLDATGTSKRAAQVHVQMGNHQCITVTAGGSGKHSWPAFSPYQSYEVILDHEPARFWTKYTDSAGLVYSCVPKLLVTHHIIRHGGALSIITERCNNLRSCSIMEMRIEVPDDEIGLVEAFVTSLRDAKVMSSRALW